MLSSKGSSGTCIPEVLRHSYIALSRRTNSTYYVVVNACRPLRHCHPAITMRLSVGDSDGFRPRSMRGPYVDRYRLYPYH